MFLYGLIDASTRGEQAIQEGGLVDASIHMACGARESLKRLSRLDPQAIKKSGRGRVGGHSLKPQESRSVTVARPDDHAPAWRDEALPTAKFINAQFIKLEIVPKGLQMLTSS